jgi:hypothetical protein
LRVASLTANPVLLLKVTSALTALDKKAWKPPRLAEACHNVLEKLISGPDDFNFYAA